MRTRVAWVPVLLVWAGCGKPPVVQPYEVVEAESRPITVQVKALGVVQPAESTVILSRASGQVTDVTVGPGDEVKGGQLLVRVDARSAESDLAQAVANVSSDSTALVTADHTEQLEKQLLADQAVTPTEYDSVKLVAAQAVAALVSAKSALDNAKIEVENTNVRAPGPGVVLSVAVNDGTIIPSAVSSTGASEPLLTLGDLDTVEVISDVSEKDVGKLCPGLDANVSVDAYQGEHFSGKVTIVEPQSILQNNETYFPVHVVLANPGHRLKPGMNAELSIQIGDSKDALAVPIGALRPRNDLETAAGMLGVPLATIQQEVGKGEGNYAIFVRRKGAPEALMIRTGVNDGDYAAVTAGDLKAGDTLLILPSTSLVKSEDAFTSRMKRFTSLPGVKQ